MMEDRGTNVKTVLCIALAWLIARVLAYRFFIKLKYLLPAILLIAGSRGMAQDSVGNKSGLSWNINLDLYYSYDFSRPANHEKPSFLYNHKRHNEFSVNLALLNLKYESDQIRANLGLMTGTYAAYNLAAEPRVLQNLYKATAGVKLAKKKSLWLDAGIMPSHIGFESAISKECWTLTRSIAAENSPYYEAGIKVGLTSANKKWYMAALLLNGWQRMTRAYGNTAPAFGSQLKFTASDKWTFNYSTYAGKERSDSNTQRRYFQNFYAIWQPLKNFGVTVGFDLGFQQIANASSAFNNWHTGVLLAKYEKEGWVLVARAEYFKDDKGVIIPVVGIQRIGLQGYSINFDLKLNKQAVWRTEARMLSNTHPLFQDRNELSKYWRAITTAISVKFE